MKGKGRRGERGAPSEASVQIRLSEAKKRGYTQFWGEVKGFSFRRGDLLGNGQLRKKGRGYEVATSMRSLTLERKTKLHGS